ncbi:MAG: glucokinase [Candidatus Nitrohelix vancouverensis]|uniref:Glucokinase n=1 Tax=Candidatus Nitrohelix vancouverensis TaxID=2705534 RepID=A0A7T0G3S9_9BACT|nr:MAG: glucokinase [Candidatus Nitrohelix vancouverensis]
MILAGDIGGTKVNLALYEERAGRLEPIRCERYSSLDSSGLEPILDEFLSSETVDIQRACFGVAGPVKSGVCRVTNLSWEVSASALKKRLGTDRVFLLNDLAAMASSIPFLSASQCVELQGGASGNGRIAVLAAGTGMGQAFLWPQDDGRREIIDTEGGHCDFAPRTTEEAELLRFFLKRWDRVSIERVLSGDGLAALHQFLSSPQEQEALSSADVIRYGLSGEDAVCRQALQWFASLYGACAGNLALQILAEGGVYVGGGLAPRLLPVLQEGGFMEAFRAKGRFSAFLEKMPVRVIVDENAPLLGAARFAQAAQ